MKSFQSVVQEARSGRRLSISSIRVLLLLINEREKLCKDMGSALDSGQDDETK